MVGREHLLVRRERKQANQAVKEAKRREADARALKARQAALVAFAAKLTSSERNYLLTMGAVPSSRIELVPQYELRQERVKDPDSWSGWRTVTKRYIVGRSLCLPAEIAQHYPNGVISRGDLAVLQQGA